MVDMFIVYRTCMAMMHEYEPIKIMCNYCPICNTLQIDFACAEIQIFAHHRQQVNETDEALFVLHKLFYDFVLQPNVVGYLRRNKNDNSN